MSERITSGKVAPSVYKTTASSMVILSSGESKVSVLQRTGKAICWHIDTGTAGVRCL